MDSGVADYSWKHWRVSPRVNSIDPFGIRQFHMNLCNLMVVFPQVAGQTALSRSKLQKGSIKPK